MIVFDYADFVEFTDMYQAIVDRLLHHPQYQIAPRGLKINEIVNASVIVNPKDCSIDFTKTKAPERQEVYDKYKKAEHDWYMSGNTLASSAPSKFWNQLAQADGHITSNYGHMMLFDKMYPRERAFQGLGEADETIVDLGVEPQTPFERVVETLKKDRDSRQAIVHYGQPRHYWPGNKDQPCTLSGQFFIRGDRLYFTVHQRSCDLIKGYSYDIPWQAHFMKMVMDKLNSEGMSLELGELTMVFGSLHLYEKDFDLARRITQTVQ